MSESARSNPDSAPLCLEDRIDLACDTFEVFWRADRRASLEDALASVPRLEWPAFLRELLPVEWELRLAAGEQPRAEDYLGRFHELGEFVRTMVDELQAAISDPLKTRAPSDVTPDSPPPPAGSIATVASGRAEGTSPGESTHRSPAGGEMMIGDHLLLGEIARGGMGVVYRARQPGVNRVVALKMMLSGQFATSDEVARFRAEAEAAGRLDHPHIVPVFEVGEHDGRPWFTMGFVEGRSLRALLADGPLPPRRAAELSAALARAVNYAHTNGIVHRDLKPANVLIDTQGEPRVTDFGLAKRSTDDSGLTATGQILGTPSFMPPEQATGRLDQVGPLSDVYSLGAMLYNMLTGRPPFQAATVTDTLRLVIDQEPTPPRRLNPHVPVDLETICLKCLRKSPADRYESAAELADDLNRHLGDFPIRARPTSRLEHVRRWVRRNPLASLLTGVVALAVVAASVSLYRSVTAELERKDALLKVADAERKEAEARVGFEAERRKRDVAAKEAATATQTSAFFSGLFLRLDPLRIGPGLAEDEPIPVEDAGEVVRRGVEQARDFAKDEPLLRAAILDNLGHVCRSRSDYERAAPLLKEALDLRVRELQPKDPNHPDLATSLFNYGWLLHDQAKFAEARQHLEQALAIREQLDAGTDPQRNRAKRLLVASTKAMLAWTLSEAGDRPRAQAMFREVYATRLAELGPDKPETQLAQAYVFSSLDADGVNATEIASLLGGKDKTRLAIALLAYNKIRTLRANRKFEDAEKIYLELIRELNRIFGDVDHPVKAMLHGDFAGMLMEQSNLVRARAEMETAVKLGVRTMGRHPKIAEPIQRYAEALSSWGEDDAASRWLRKAIEIADKASPESVAVRRNFRTDLAAACRRQGRIEESIAAASEVLDVFDPHDFGLRIRVSKSLAESLADLERFDEAESRLRALDSWTIGRDDESAIVSARRELARFLAERGRAQDAGELTSDILRRIRSRVEALPGSYNATVLMTSQADFVESSAGADELKDLVRRMFPDGAELMVSTEANSTIVAIRKPDLLFLDWNGRRAVGKTDGNDGVTISEWGLSGRQTDDGFEWGSQRWIPLARWLEKSTDRDRREEVEGQAVALARLLSQIGDNAAALPLLDAVISGRTAIHEPPPVVAEIRWRRARVLSGLGRHDEAIAELRSVRDVYLEFLGDRHRDVGPLSLDIASALLKADRPDEALAQAREAADSRLKLHGAGHPLAGETCRRAGELLIASTRAELVAAGNPLLECAQSIADARFPAAHSERHHTALLRARGLLNSGDAKKAESVLRTMRPSLQAGAAVTLRAAEIDGALGEALLAQRRFDEAAPLLGKSSTTLAALVTPHDARVRRLRAALARLREESGRPGTAGSARDAPSP